MNIKDLSTSKELDHKAMTEVRGGLDFNFFDIDTSALVGQAVTSSSGGPAIGTQVVPVTSTVIGIDLDLSHLLG